jgi:hypothetical protein
VRKSRRLISRVKRCCTFASHAVEIRALAADATFGVVHSLWLAIFRCRIHRRRDLVQRTAISILSQYSRGRDCISFGRKSKSAVRA